MSFNTDLHMSRSYYAVTAAPTVEHTALLGETDADLVVVGGGCTGLSAALHAARRGLSVVLLEGGRIGWGASGRNGGQIIPGLRLGAVELVKRQARRQGQTAIEQPLPDGSIRVQIAVAA